MPLWLILLIAAVALPAGMLARAYDDRRVRRRPEAGKNGEPR